MQVGAWLRQSAAKRKSNRLMVAAACLLFFVSALTFAADKKLAAEPAVDSGSFAVLMGGRRVGTETFSISQSSEGSSITSHFKTETGTERAEQSSDLELYANGDLRKYEWHELAPGTIACYRRTEGKFSDPTRMEEPHRQASGAAIPFACLYHDPR